MNPKASRYFTYIRPIFRSKAAKTYSSLIFSLLAISIFSYFAIRPTVTTILSLQKSITERSEVLKTLHEKVNNLTAGKNNYAGINPKTKTKLENLVPNSPQLTGVIDSITIAANDAQATISGLQFQPIILENEKDKLNKNASLNEVSFTLNSQGSFASLMKLLTILQRSDRLFSIASINFAQPPEGSLIMSITAKAFYMKN